MIYIQRIRKSCIDKNVIWQNQRKLQTFNEIKWTNFKQGRNIYNDTRQHDPLLASKQSNCLCVLSRVWLFATAGNIAYQAPLSVWFPRQEYWSRLPFPSPGDLPNPGIKSGSPALQVDFFYHWATIKGDTKISDASWFNSVTVISNSEPCKPHFCNSHNISMFDLRVRTL